MTPQEEINKKLLQDYGYFTFTDKPKYRLVWSMGHTEKRVTDRLDNGLQLLYPEVRELPKYEQWAANCWIVEVCLAVPESAETDLIDKYSYEPLWVFRPCNTIEKIPSWPAIHTIIETRNNNMRLAGQYVKYKDQNETREEYNARIEALAKEIYEDVTPIEIALATGSGVSLVNTRKETVN